MTWLCVILAILAIQGNGVDDPPPPYDDTSRGSEADARALIAAMAINDASLVSMSWEQENQRQAGAGWELAEKSTWRFQDDRWVYDQTAHLLTEEGSKDIIQVRRRSAFDGWKIKSFAHSVERGTVRELRPADYVVWNTPLKSMGRFIDGKRTAAELLAGAQDLKVRQSTGSTAVVIGYVQTASKAWFLELEIALDKGFALQRYTLYDGLLRWPIESVAVDRFEVHEGVWIPVSGTDSLWNLPAQISDTRWDELQRVLGRIARERGIDPADGFLRRTVRDTINTIYGERGIPVESMGPVHRLSVSKIASVNVPIRSEDIDIVVPAGAVIVDFFRLRASNGMPVGIGP